MSMEDALTNITSAMEQQQNRQTEAYDPCTAPVYGPSFSSQYHQFIDVQSGYGSAVPFEFGGGCLEAMEGAYCGAPPFMCPHCYCGFPPMAMPGLHSQVMMHNKRKQHFAEASPGGFGSGRNVDARSFVSQNMMEAPAPEPCQCVHCQAAQLSMMTPQRNPEACATHVMESPDEQYAAVSPNSNTRSPASPQRTPMRHGNSNYQTPPRKENTGKSRSERRRGGQQRNETRGGHKQTLLETVSRTQPQTTTQNYTVTLQGHFGRRYTALSHNAVSQGEFVVFEGDRGEDLGEVIASEMTVAPPTRMPLIIRPASLSEIDFWKNALQEKAQQAVDQCNVAVEELSLPLVVVKAVFQFDKKKLTFFYESDDRVDFRRLLSQMYNKFHCRIWMERAETLTDGAADAPPPVGMSPDATARRN